MDANTERYRAECEARQWIRWGYTVKHKTDELRGRIAKKRGEAAADKLIQDMRDQFKLMKGGR